MKDLVFGPTIRAAHTEQSISAKSCQLSSLSFGPERLFPRALRKKFMPSCHTENLFFSPTVLGSHWSASYKDKNKPTGQKMNISLPAHTVKKFFARDKDAFALVLLSQIIPLLQICSLQTCYF